MATSIQPTTVRTMCTLDADVTVCDHYTAINTLAMHVTDDVKVTSRQVLEVHLDDNGQLQLTSSEVSGNWSDYACAARDKHEQNIEAYEDELTGDTMLRTTRHVTCGEELLVWFSDSVSRLHDIPALTPHNIRGSDEYVCTVCLTTFQTPNPLKSHIRYHCQQHISPPAATTQHFSSLPTVFPALLPTWYTPPQSLRLPSVSSSLNPWYGNWLSTLLLTHTLYQQYLQYVTAQTDDVMQTNMTSRTVAHTNYQKQFNILPPPLCSLPCHLPSSPALNKLHSANNDVTQPATCDVTDSSLLPTSSSDDVTALRHTSHSSSRGYTCLYCGKLYSRKYGLKIHVRTHTGFKPLSCQVCDRAFGDPSNLNKHIRLHATHLTSSYSPYTCQYCHKVLVRRRDLERHIRSRHQTDDVMANTAVTSSENIVI